VRASCIATTSRCWSTPTEADAAVEQEGAEGFIAAGKQLGIEVDPIGKNDYQRLAEYDGLFIRETTASDNHTYRFAHRAEKEGMVVMDDPTRSCAAPTRSSSTT
jgi:glutathione synthase/RimK-type ligase-like ATP-grasp enzyme